MKKTTFGYKQTVTSEMLNERFADLAGGSILNGFRLAKGTGNYSISLRRMNDKPSAAITEDGVRVMETADVIDAIVLRPNTNVLDRFDVIYVAWRQDAGAEVTFDYTVVEGVPGLPVNIETKPANRLPLGYVRIRTNTAPTVDDLTSLDIGVKFGTLYANGMIINGTPVLTKSYVDGEVQKNKERIVSTETEIAAARKTYPTLNDMFVGEMAQKANVLDVEQKFNLIGNASPKGVYATVTALQTALPTGNSNIYVVSADGKWYYWNGTAWTAGGVYQGLQVAEKSIGVEEIKFITPGKNKFDKTKRVLNSVISDVNGSISSDLGTGYDASEYIPVVAGQQYTINKARKYALYNSAKVFVSGYDNTSYSSNGIVNFTPNTSGYVRFYVGQSFIDTTQMEQGANKTEYEAFKNLADNLSVSKLEKGIVTDEHVSPSSNILMRKLGKNLFNMNAVTSGYYVNYGNGNLVANTDNKVSEYIQIESNTTYTLSSQINKDLSQIAFYDTNKTYVSGLPNTGIQESITFTTGANVKYIRVSIPTVVTSGVMLEKGSTMTRFEEFGYRLPVTDLPMDEIKAARGGIITEDDVSPISKIVVKKIGKNLLDITTCTEGFYANYGNGNLIANVDNKVTPFIELEATVTYTLSSQINKDLSQIAFYDANKTYVSGLPNTGTQESITFTTGANVKYIRVSIPTVVKDGVMLEKGSKMTPFESFGYYVSIKDLPSEALYKPSTFNVIKVKKDGQGDFTSLRSAMAIAKGTVDNPCTVEVYEGIYDVFSDYSVVELNDPAFDGLRIPNYVNLKGIGNRKKIIINGFLPDTTDQVTSTSHGRISTICPLGNGNIENVTITGKNVRYSVHDDYNYPNCFKVMKDCDFVRYKGNGTNYGGKQAWGEGSWSGQSYYFENCSFSTEFDYYAYTSHNNFDFTNPSLHKFVNCSFQCANGQGAVRFESLGSGMVEPVEMIGVRINACIDFTVHPTNATGEINHRLSGYGNDVTLIRFFPGDSKTYVHDFAEESRKMFNVSNAVILKGQPVKLGPSAASVVALNSGEQALYYGIAAQDIPRNSYGLVRTSGFVKASDIGLTTLVTGDTVGIVENRIDKVTIGEKIGVVLIDDYIKLK